MSQLYYPTKTPLVNIFFFLMILFPLLLGQLFSLSGVIVLPVGANWAQINSYLDLIRFESIFNSTVTAWITKYIYIYTHTNVTLIYIYFLGKIKLQWRWGRRFQRQWRGSWVWGKGLFNKEGGKIFSSKCLDCEKTKYCWMLHNVIYQQLLGRLLDCYLFLLRKLHFTVKELSLSLPLMADSILDHHIR